MFDRWRRTCFTCGLLLSGLFGGGLARSADISPAPPDYFHVIKIDRDTYAISEPKYWQANVSYLLVGAKRALLFDTGPGIYSIREEVKKLTSVPVLVVPSHLHFDHVGRIQEFSAIGLIDLPALRAQVHQGVLVETPEQFLITSSVSSFRVTEWIKDGTVIDLGERQVMLVSTPGHTRNSVSLVEIGRHQLFTGDLANREVTLVDMPDSDIHALVRSLQRLLALAPRGSLAHEAHSERPISWDELAAFAKGTAEIEAHRAPFKPACVKSIPQRCYDVGFPVLMPGESSGPPFPFLSSVTEEFSWDSPCS